MYDRWCRVTIYNALVDRQRERIDHRPRLAGSAYAGGYDQTSNRRWWAWWKEWNKAILAEFKDVAPVNARPEYVLPKL